MRSQATCGRKKRYFLKAVAFRMGFQKLKSFSRHEVTEENGDFFVLEQRFWSSRLVFQIKTVHNQLYFIQISRFLSFWDIAILVR